MEPEAISAANAEFWDELCGSHFAQSLGITEATPESLRRFDAAFFALYPYIFEFVPVATLPGKRILEIGLGYGTLGQLLAGLGVDYTGLDIAAMPVSMMQQRLAWLGLEDSARAVQGSVLQMPFDEASFDMVYAIGSLHHAGDLPRALSEVRRVLRPGGTTVFMVYNGRSFRRVSMRLRAARTQLRGRLQGDQDALARARYDSNSAGEGAPHTDFVTRQWLRGALRDLGFSPVDIRSRNWDNMYVRGRYVPRERWLGTVDRVAGLDLYVSATRL